MSSTITQASDWQVSKPHPNLVLWLIAAVLIPNTPLSKKSFGGKMFLWSVILEHPIPKCQSWNSMREGSLKSKGVFKLLPRAMEAMLPQSHVLQPTWNFKVRSDSMCLKDQLTWILYHFLCKDCTSLVALAKSLDPFYIEIILHTPPASITSSAVLFLPAPLC